MFQTLTVLYDKILRTLQKMPEDATYRKNTQVIIEDRLIAVKSVRGFRSVNCSMGAYDLMIIIVYLLYL